MAEQKRMTNENLAGGVLDLLESRISAKYLLSEEGEEIPRTGIMGLFQKGKKIAQGDLSKIKLNKQQEDLVEKYSVRLEKINKYATALKKALGAASDGEFGTLANKLEKDSEDRKSDFDSITNIGEFKKVLEDESVQDIITVGTQLAMVMKEIGLNLKKSKDIVDVVSTVEGSFGDALGKDSNLYTKAENIIEQAFNEQRKVYQVLTKQDLEDIPDLQAPPSVSSSLQDSLKEFSIDASSVKGNFLKLPTTVIRVFYIGAQGTKAKEKSVADKTTTIKEIEDFIKQNSEENNTNFHAMLIKLSDNREIKSILDKFSNDKIEQAKNDFIKQIKSDQNKDLWLQAQKVQEDLIQSKDAKNIVQNQQNKP